MDKARRPESSSNCVNPKPRSDSHLESEMSTSYDAHSNLIESLARDLLDGSEDAYPIARRLADRIKELIDARIEALTGAIE